MFGEVAKRDEHLQNMKKFEKCFDLHQTIFKQRQTLPNTKFIIERVAKRGEHLQNMKVEDLPDLQTFQSGIFVQSAISITK